jgi:hypothetical protein
VTHDGGIKEEAAELGVLEEHAVDRGRVAIGAGDDRLQIVADQLRRVGASLPNEDR